MIAQRLRFVAAIIAGGFVCACSNPGDTSLSTASAPSVVVAHASGPIRIGGITRPVISVAVDSSTHDVYFTENRIGLRKITPGGVITTLVGVDRYENPPHDVAVDSSTHDVYYINSSRSYLKKIAPNGSETLLVVGHLYSVAVDSYTHDIYLGYYVDWRTFNSDYGVKKFAPDGAPISCVTGTSRPKALIHTNTIWTACYNSDLREPRGVAVDPSGLSGWVYIADTGHNLIKKVEKNGTVTIIGSSQEFRYPLGVAMDKTRDAFVADSGHNEVKEIFRPCSCVTARWSFYSPRAVAIDAGTGGGQVRSDIYVADLKGLWKISP